MDLNRKNTKRLVLLIAFGVVLYWVLTNPSQAWSLISGFFSLFFPFLLGGCLCFLGMLIFRLPYAGVISVIIGFTALIPIFGAFIGVAIGALLILLVNPIQALWFILFIIVLQQIESNVIYPRVVGKSVGLPGIWVLAAVTLGGNAFGLLGMLFAVPLCSVLYAVARRVVHRRLAQKGLAP